MRIVSVSVVADMQSYQRKKYPSFTMLWSCETTHLALVPSRLLEISAAASGADPRTSQRCQIEGSNRAIYQTWLIV